MQVLLAEECSPKKCSRASIPCATAFSDRNKCVFCPAHLYNHIHNTESEIYEPLQIDQEGGSALRYFFNNHNLRFSIINEEDLIDHEDYSQKIKMNNPRIDTVESIPNCEGSGKVKNMFSSQSKNDHATSQDQVEPSAKSNGAPRPDSSIAPDPDIVRSNGEVRDSIVTQLFGSNYPTASYFSIPKTDDSKSQPPSSTTPLDSVKKASVSSVVLRTLITTLDAGAIIGHKGKVISEIRKITGCKAEVSGLPPHSYERIMTVTGNPHNLAEAYYLIAKKLAESSVFDDHPGGSRLNNVVIRLLVVHPQVGSIIGKAGARIQEIQEKSGVRIAVSKNTLSNSAERVVELSGTPKNIESSILLISKCIGKSKFSPSPTTLYTPELSSDRNARNGIKKTNLKTPADAKASADIKTSADAKAPAEEKMFAGDGCLLQQNAVMNQHYSQAASSAPKNAYLQKTPRPGPQAKKNEAGQQRPKIVGDHSSAFLPSGGDVDLNGSPAPQKASKIEEDLEPLLPSSRSAKAQKCFVDYAGFKDAAGGDECLPQVGFPAQSAGSNGSKKLQEDDDGPDDIASMSFLEVFEKVYGFPPPSNPVARADSDPFEQSQEEATYAISVPSNVVGCILGRSGSIIARIRRISGAKLRINDFIEGQNSRMMTITGVNWAIKKALLLIYIQLEAGKYDHPPQKQPQNM